MKVNIDKKHLDAIKRTCIEGKFDFQVVENESEDTVSVWIRDQKFGELSPGLAFWCGVQFRGAIETEIWNELMSV